MIDTSLLNHTELKLKELTKILVQYNHNGNSSLLGGSAGVAFSLMHLAQINKNERFYDKSIYLLEELIGQENSKWTASGLSHSGLSGIAWMINFMIKHEMIETDTEELLEEVDSTLKHYCVSLPFEDKPSLDFLHGLQGIAFYFLQRDNSDNLLDLILSHLEYQAIRESDNSLKWIFTNALYNTSSYNLSLSHGISSIIGIMIAYVKNETFVIRAKKILEGAIKYLIKNQLDLNSHASYFPSVIPLEHNSGTQNTGSSRLAWCYGDLGIAYQLYEAGLILNNVELTEYAIKVLEYNSSRIDEHSHHGIVDAGLCHGAAGVALIYDLMASKSNSTIFRETSQYWLKQAISFANHKDGLAGFKSFHHPHFQNDYSLLEGISGIALLFSNAIKKNPYPWHEFLLL